MWAVTPIEVATCWLSRNASRATITPSPGPTARTRTERYEVVEGYPVMSPGAGYRHQLCQSVLLEILRAASPPGHDVLAAPFDWVLWQIARSSSARA